MSKPTLTTAEPARPRRRRGEELEEAIYEAVWAELAALGYRRLTMEAVAVRAGTSKPVLYRRWSSRAELVLAAWRHRHRVLDEPPDTGSLRADLLALLRRSMAGLEELPGDVLSGLVSDTIGDPDVSARLQAQIGKGAPTRIMETILGRAVERGEIGTVALTPRVARLPFDLLRADILLGGAPVRPSGLAEIVDDVLLPVLRARAAD